MVDLLHLLKQFFTEKWFMGVFCYDPFVFGRDVIRDAAIETLTAFLLS